MTPEFIEMGGQRYRVVTDPLDCLSSSLIGEVESDGVTYRLGVQQRKDRWPVKIAYRVGVVAKGTWVHRHGQDKE